MLNYVIISPELEFKKLDCHIQLHDGFMKTVMVFFETSDDEGWL